MNIGIDYDDTYTRDKVMWNDLIDRMCRRGHQVYLITWRFPNECNEVHLDLGGRVHGIYPTSRQAKEKFMYKHGIRIDVWIDDNPSSILYTMEGYQQ
jgi:acid phosphatase class B